jgi:hypothetical protein
MTLHLAKSNVYFLKSPDEMQGAEQGTYMVGLGATFVDKWRVTFHQLFPEVKLPHLFFPHWLTILLEPLLPTVHNLSITWITWEVRSLHWQHSRGEQVFNHLHAPPVLQNKLFVFNRHKLSQHSVTLLDKSYHALHKGCICSCPHLKGIQGVAEVQLHPFLTLTPDGDKWLTSHISHFTFRNNLDTYILLCCFLTFLQNWCFDSNYSKVVESSVYFCTVLLLIIVKTIR